MPHHTFSAYWVLFHFHSPLNADMDYKIFNVRMWSFCMCTCMCTWRTSVYNYSLIQRTFVTVCTEFDSGEISGRSQSLAHNSQPSIWWPQLIRHNFGFRERVLGNVHFLPRWFAVLRWYVCMWWWWWWGEGGGHIHMSQFIPYYASALHMHTLTCIIKTIGGQRTDGAKTSKRLKLKVFL